MSPYLAFITLLLFPQSSNYAVLHYSIVVNIIFSGIGDGAGGSGDCMDLVLCPDYTSDTNTTSPTTTLAPVAPSVNPTPNVQSNETSRSTSDGLSGGAVAGIVVGVVVAIAVSAGIATVSVILIL